MHSLCGQSLWHDFDALHTQHKPEAHAKQCFVLGRADVPFWCLDWCRR